MLSEGKNVDILYLDFSKAFDLVDHSILLRKLKEKGITGNLLHWIQNFLGNRKQCVRIENTLSREAPLHSGVPQGSVLGPLLFLVYISDLDKNLKDASIGVLKYVDDSKLICEVTEEDDVFENQNSINDIYEWADTNNMQWNQLKFQLLRLGNNK